MAFNLLEASKGLFTNKLISKAGAYLGEKECSITKALSAIIPTILRLFSDKAASVNGANTLSLMAKGQQNPSTYQGLCSYFSNEGGTLMNKGALLANELFGNKIAYVTGNISSYAGIKHSSASSLLSMALPALLGFVEKQSVANYNGNIANVFEGQKINILDAIPVGVDLKYVFGSTEIKVSDISKYQKKIVDHASNHHYINNGKRGRIRWLLPLLLLLLATITTWCFLRKGGNRPAVEKARGIDATKNSNDSKR